MRRHLVVRADADARIGSGHVMRCLALAQGWQERNGSATFVLAGEAPALEGRLRSEGMDVVRLAVEAGSDEDASATAETAGRLSASWVLVDGCHFDAGFQQALKRSGARLFVLDDDGHAEHYFADLVLNQNLHARESLYARREPGTRLLLGLRYVLLRREFRTFRRVERDVPLVARRILVTLGGSDRENHTLRVLEALERLEAEEIHAVAVVGGGNPHACLLEDAAGRSRVPVRLVRNATNMPELMAASDVAFSTAGTTVWELAYMGVPSLVGATSPLEDLLCAGLRDQNLFTPLGRLERVSAAELAVALGGIIHDEESRREMSARGQSLVDGRGVARVVARLEEEVA